MFKNQKWLNFKYYHSENIPCNFAKSEKMIEILKAGTLIKDDKSTRITYAFRPYFENPVIIKKFKFKGWLHSIIRSLNKPRSEIFWEGSQLISALGINTPKALGIVKIKTGPLTTESYVITEFYTGQNAKQLIDHPERFSQKIITEFVDKVIEILATLFKNNITHGDTKVPNFMIKDQDVCIIDLDVVRIHKSPKKLKKHIQKDIERFERDWENHPYKEAVLSKTKILRKSFLDK
ncbi:protein kinase domain-containing protein [Endozoicomonas lisbonensis]|uniref:tRNA A-37 threonylcarbamoyl transferase component Bud32 n=1 Tax=Endozoicomonas lisbonensis TaxID=3120522 RepID=A0ABV2SIJ3_9GAMM